MLRCVGDHIAANLFSVQVSRKLLQARELEAFQTMATFFVHDLKNAASTLKLMLQNLPVHFDDPEFRADALRGTAKTVNHIDHLIGRLGSLRHELKVKPTLVDLSELVQGLVKPYEEASQVRFIKDFQQGLSVTVDPEQIGKVITNMLLNAIEASSTSAMIEVACKQKSPGVAMVVVRDEGAGMSPEFMAESLFKPFKTTKKGGLGIGMFQSKLIVEAHGGKIDVSSEVGRGSRFEICFPVSNHSSL